ncbi:MAG: hypothetical protein WD851_12120 [Pirellulales bacterium]
MDVREAWQICADELRDLGLSAYYLTPRGGIVSFGVRANHRTLPICVTRLNSGMYRFAFFLMSDGDEAAVAFKTSDGTASDIRELATAIAAEYFPEAKVSALRASEFRPSNAANARDGRTAIAK